MQGRKSSIQPQWAHNVLYVTNRDKTTTVKIWATGSSIIGALLIEVRIIPVRKEEMKWLRKWKEPEVEEVSEYQTGCIVKDSYIDYENLPPVVNDRKGLLPDGGLTSAHPLQTEMTRHQSLQSVCS